MGKFLVTFGGIVGVIGLFLPFAEVTEKLGLSVRRFSVTVWGGEIVTEYQTETIAIVLLLFFLLVVLVGLWAFATRLGQAKAMVIFVAALVPATLSIYWIVLTRSRANATVGLGLLLIAGGGLLSVVGSILALFRPDRPSEPP
jgi:hypothetical protein